MESNEENSVEGQNVNSDETSFQPHTPAGEDHESGSRTEFIQFRVEVADGDQGKVFTIRPLGNGRYEILDDEGSVGSIMLDESNHAHCESVGCEIDTPLLHAIRDQIQFHEEWTQKS